MPVLNPDTAISWLYARLLQHAPLTELLGSTAGDPRIYQAGWVNDAAPLFVVIKPPANPQTTIYAGRWPQTMAERFLIYAEARSDRLSDGQTLDEVLTPIHMAMQDALLGPSSPLARLGGESPTGGLVHSCLLDGFYAPPPIRLGADLNKQHKGMYVRLLSS